MLHPTLRIPIMPTTTHAPVKATVRFVIELPDDLLAAYESQASEQGLTPNELIARRLAQCVSHNDARSLYFNDADREDLEQTLGGGMFSNAKAVLRALTTRYTVRVSGSSPIKLEEGLYTTLKTRSKETGEPLADMIQRAVSNGLSDEAWGHH